MNTHICRHVDVFSGSDLFEEGRGVEFPRKPATLADCTTLNDEMYVLK